MSHNNLFECLGFNQGLPKGKTSGSMTLDHASTYSQALDIMFNSYGALIEIDIEDDYLVDTINIIAFTDCL